MFGYVVSVSLEDLKRIEIPDLEQTRVVVVVWFSKSYPKMIKVRWSLSVDISY